jgi:hypothetical protein
MENRKYVGMDMHQASISVAVRDETGKLIIESVLETKASTILEFLHGLRGSLWVAFGESTSAKAKTASPSGFLRRAFGMLFEHANSSKAES